MNSRGLAPSMRFTSAFWFEAGLVMRRVAIGAAALALIATDNGDVPPAVQARNTHVVVGDGALAHYDYPGLVHLHTAYSDDATGTYESLAAAASAQGIRFLIVTDHNTLKPIEDNKPGWRDGVLMMTGVESSRPEGHLLALGVRTTVANADAPTEAFLTDVARQGGQTLLAHPTHRRWAWKGPVDDRVMGLEILDLADQFYAAPTVAKAAAVAALPFRKIDAYLELDSRPDVALRLWDEIGARRRFVGVYAPDLHQAMELSDDLKIPFPPAADIMRIARNHIVSDAPFSGRADHDEGLIRDALAEGRLFVSLDTLGDGTGFMFTAKGASDTAWMGDEVRAGSARTYHVDLPEAAQRLGATARLYRDGRRVAQSRPGDRSLTFSSADAGVYRVEVAATRTDLSGRRREIIWIYSNPIYARA